MNLLRPTIVALVAVAGLLEARSEGQTAAPPPNAALRYWMAFAVMRDPPADKATADLIDQVAESRSPWDESQLGRILDANREALDIMRRASTLPSCDWGVEYELGPNAPIAHLAKARVLGRLNVLAGMRLAATGQAPAAVDVWLTSVRFSQHVAQGGSLISLLSARRVLIPTLRALARAVSTGTLDAAQRKKIDAAMRALPETAFDWSAAMRREEASLVVTLARLAAARDPAAYFAAVTQLPARPPHFVPPSSGEIAAYHAAVTRIVEAFSLAPDQERERLADIDDNVRKTLHVFFQRTLPSAQMVQGARSDVRVHRQEVLTALSRS